jgi:nucleoside 2-deoxyribosyltransferase
LKSAFVSVSFAHKDELATELAAISEALQAAGFRVCVFVQEYHFSPDQQQAMMTATLAELRRSDLLVAEVSHKAIGVGIEIGYAAALDKPILYLRQASAEPSTTVGGLASVSIVYDHVDDLRDKLTDVLLHLPYP